MGLTSRPQSKSSAKSAAGSGGRAYHATAAKNKDKLKSDHDSTMSANPAAQQDQFGSRHNDDKAKLEQRRITKPRGASDLAFRESAQDESPARGAKNRQAGRRSSPKARKAAKVDAKAKAKA